MATRPSRIQREIKQTRPFRSLGQETFVALLRTADRVRGAAAARIEPHRITLQQYNVLRILRGAGTDGLPTLEIGSRMIEQSPGITRLLDRLEAKRLVSRERCPTDRRQVTCRIATRGLELLATLDPIVAAGDDLVGGDLSKAELRELVGLLDRIRAGIDGA